MKHINVLLIVFLTRNTFLRLSCYSIYPYIDELVRTKIAGLVQNYSNSIANALELL